MITPEIQGIIIEALKGKKQSQDPFEKRVGNLTGQKGSPGSGNCEAEKTSGDATECR